MSRIAFIGAGAQVASVTSPQTPPLPNGIRQGDLMLMVIGAMPSGTAGTADTVTITGWTQQGSTQRQEIGTIDVSVQLWYKIAGSTETAPSVAAGTALAGTGTTTGWSAQIAVFRGVDQTTPFDVSNVGTGGAAAATFTPTGGLTATNNAVAVSAVVTADDNALGFSVSQSFLLLMGGVNYDTTVGSDHAVGLAVKEIAVAGSVTMPTWSETVNGNDAWAAISTSLRPDSTTWTMEETWLLPDASTWPVMWSTGASTGSVVDTLAGGGRLKLGTVGSGGDDCHGNVVDATFPDDFEMWVDLVLDNVADEHYPVYEFRFDNGVGTTHYVVQVDIGGGNCTVHIAHQISGVTTDLYNSGGAAYVIGDVIHFHTKAVGHAIQFAWWKNNAADPGAGFHYNATDSLGNLTGSLELAHYGGAGVTGPAVRWRALQVAAVPSVSPPPRRRGIPLALLAR